MSGMYQSYSFYCTCHYATIYEDQLLDYSNLFINEPGKLLHISPQSEEIAAIFLPITEETAIIHIHYFFSKQFKIGSF